jgi:hypothetical protein
MELISMDGQDLEAMNLVGLQWSIRQMMIYEQYFEPQEGALRVSWMLLHHLHRNR